MLQPPDGGNWATNRVTEWWLPNALQFDFNALKTKSNQRATSDPTDTFRMRVRRIVVTEWADRNAELVVKADSWLQVIGLRYNKREELGNRDATAQVKAWELPPEIWMVIRDEVPAELWPGGVK